MSKPDDIPQDVWDATMEICGDIPYGQGPAVTVCAEQIARAILAAKAEEREACAVLVRTAPMRFAGQTETIIRARMSDAIRKRGEA